MSGFTPVAYRGSDRLPFGPGFESEEEAWRWLHGDDLGPVPFHDRIEVEPWDGPISSGGQGGDRGVMRPGSRRNGGFEPVSRPVSDLGAPLPERPQAARRAWAEDQGVRELFTGGAATQRLLRRGSERSGLRSDGRLQAEQARIALAEALLEGLNPGGDGFFEREGERIPYEAALGRLEQALGVPEGAIDPDVALRTAQFMDPRPGGPNLGLETAYGLARAEQRSVPRENRSRFQRRASEDLGQVRSEFYEQGLGRELEAAGETYPETVGNELTKAGLEDNDRALRVYREGLRTLRGDELQTAADVLGKGRKMGPGKGRNKLNAEAFSPNRLDGTPWVPVLMARRTQQPKRGGPIAPTVQQPRYKSDVGEDTESAWRLANYGGKQAPEGRDELEWLRTPGKGRMQLNANSNAERDYAYDPSALRMMTLNPKAVLDPDALRSVAAEGEALERIETLARLIEDYARPVPLSDKSLTGSYEAVGIPGRERNPLDPDGPVPGFSRLQDPGVVMTKEVKYPTLGQLASRIMQRHRTPMHLMSLGDGDKPYLVQATGTVLDDGRVINGRLPSDLIAAEGVAQLATPKGMQMRAIMHHPDGSATIGPQVFKQGVDLQRIDTGALVNPFRVGSSKKVADLALAEFGELLNGLMAAQGLDGDWQMVGDSWVNDPVTFAAQNEMLRDVFDDEMMAGAGQFRGEFPARVQRAGRDWTPQRNPMLGVMGLMELLARGVVEDDTRIDGRPMMAPGEPGYQELWSDVAQPRLEEARQTLQARAASAPGMRASDVSGRVFPGVRLLPQADRPGILPTNAVINQAPLPEGIDMPTLQRALVRPDLVDRGTLAVIDQWVAENAPRQGGPTKGLGYWSDYPQAEAVRAPVGEQLGGEVRGSWLVKPGATERPVAGLLAQTEGVEMGAEARTLYGSDYRQPRQPAVGRDISTMPDYGGLLAQAQAGRQQRLAEEAAVPEDRTRLALAKARLLGLLR